MLDKHGKDVTSHQSLLARNDSRSNGKTSTNGQMTPDGHEHQRLAPASCRRFSRQLRVVAALLTFCSTVILGSVALMHNKYNRWVVFGFSRRITDKVESEAGTLRIVPPAERPVLSSAFPDYLGSGFKSKSSNLKTSSPGSNNPKNNPNSNNPKGNAPVPKRNSLKRNNSKRSLHALDTLPRAGDIVNGDEVERTPTLLFMHLWKCAGSSLRHLLREWAQLEEQSIAIVVRCTDVVTHGETVCLQDHHFIDEKIQGARVRESEVVGGHFTWGFQNYVQQPYVMFTTLRNPLELFVSGQQYKHRKKTRVMSKAAGLVENTMMAALEHHRARLEFGSTPGNDEGGLVLPQGQGGKVVGFIFRLVDPEVMTTKTLNEATEDAIKNLDTFWLVGVVEQYQGFMAVLQSMMDPLRRHAGLWEKYAVGKYNASPNSAEKVLGAIDPDLVQEFNQTLTHQWDVYSHAVGLFQQRCRNTMSEGDLAFCDIPSPASVYTLTDLEKEELRKQVDDVHS